MALVPVPKFVGAPDKGYTNSHLVVGKFKRTPCLKNRLGVGSNERFFN